MHDQPCLQLFFHALRTFQTRLREVNEHGDIVGPARMRDHGWEVGMAVVRKADDLQAVISSMSDASVTLKLASEKFVTASVDSFLQNQWKVHKSSTEEEMATWNWPRDNVEFEKSSFKCHVMACMWAEAIMWDRPCTKVFAKPKKVVAELDFPIGKMKIPFIANKVDLKEESELLPVSCIHIGIFSCKDWIMFSLSCLIVVIMLE